MVSMIDKNIRTLIRQEIDQIAAKAHLNLGEVKKPDGSWVTDIDHHLTERVEAVLRHHFPGINIISEEGAHDLSFPAFVLDPVDGTAGLVHGTGECSLSLAYMPSPDITDTAATAYIAHIFSDFEVHNEMKPSIVAQEELGLVSRSEWKKGILTEFHHKKIKPLGSIALKLAHLYNGDASFVVTMRPKSIWDVAAGTILLNSIGFSMWHEERKILNLNQLVFSGPTLWAQHADENWIRGEFK